MLTICVCLAGIASGGQLSFAEPAPGRDTGRIYYYVPDGVDLARPAPLFIFLHGGDKNSPDTAPSRYLDEEKGWLMPVMRSAPFVVAAPSASPAVDGARWNRDGVSRYIDATIEAASKRFKIDSERIFLGGHSMGGFGAYHLTFSMEQGIVRQPLATPADIPCRAVIIGAA